VTTSSRSATNSSLVARTTTFIANFNSSVAEWRNGFYVNEYNKSKNKCESCFSSFILFMNKTHCSPASETPAAEDDEYNSEEDDDYVGTEEGEEVSLGSEDTDIDEDELQDLEEDAANNMPTTPKKKATPASNKKKAAPAPRGGDVDDVITDFMKLSTISTKPDFTYHCPVFGYHFKEGLNMSSCTILPVPRTTSSISRSFHAGGRLHFLLPALKRTPWRRSSRHRWVPSTILLVHALKHVLCRSRTT
jgi:hypothetical protein